MKVYKGSYWVYFHGYPGLPVVKFYNKDEPPEKTEMVKVRLERPYLKHVYEDISIFKWLFRRLK